MLDKKRVKEAEDNVRSYLDEGLLRKEFEKLTKFGSSFARKKGIKSEEDVAKRIQKGRGVKEQ